jgi:glycerophosphoryl diester phosphodiesterase
MTRTRTLTRTITRTALAAAAAAAALAAGPLAGARSAAHGQPTLGGARPIVIAHRGASGYRPEHTLEAYRLAVRQGADYIEPDLVMTKDGYLIARHEPMLDLTTDVATKFPDRVSTKLVDGRPTTAYFASDFTLAEIKTLRAVQQFGERSQAYNGLFEVPTLDEIIAAAAEEGRAAGRTVGIYPELKHSLFHAGLFGANVFENTLVAQLHGAYGNTREAPVFIQSFEVSNLRYLNGVTDMRLVQLFDAGALAADGSLGAAQPYDFAAGGDARTYADLLTGAGLDFVRGYADGVGPWKPYLVRTVADGVDRTGDGVVNDLDRRVDGSTGVIEAAHQRGLLVHTWTFRNDRSRLGFADPQAEMAYYYRLGLDGAFTDFPDTGAAALATVPEPATVAFTAAGLALVAGAAARRRRAGR